jgi:hypothetical protein
MAVPEDGDDQTAAGLAPAIEASDGASASTDKWKEGALDSLFDRLDIAEEEFDDFVIEDDGEIAERVCGGWLWRALFVGKSSRMQPSSIRCRSPGTRRGM